MIRKVAGLLLVVLVAGTLAPPRFRAQSTVTANTCGLTDVQNKVDAAADGDTVQVPQTGSPCTWTGTLTVNKAITVTGLGCTLDANGVPNVGTCPIIKDGGAAGTQLIIWTCVANKTQRLSHLEFQDGGVKGSLDTYAEVNVVCRNDGTTTFWFDHIYCKNMQTFCYRPNNVSGPVFNNYFAYSNGSAYPMYVYVNSHQNVGDYGDNSHYKTGGWTYFGQGANASSLVIENNDFVFSGSRTACLDGQHGSRVVFRYNRTTHCNYEQHGSEGGGRFQGIAIEEVYLNSFDMNAGLSECVYKRGGSALVFRNTCLNLDHGNGILSLNNDRAIWTAAIWGGATGHSIWDVNDAGNPFFTGTATSHGTLTMTDSMASFTTSGTGLTGYTLLDTDCSAVAGSNNCHAVITSNTSTQITFLDAGGYGTPLNFVNGHHYEINKINEIFDGSGRAGGMLLAGSTTGDFDGQPTSCGGGSCASYVNDQVTDTVYQWLNSGDAGQNLVVLIPYNEDLSLRRNVHYADYDNSKTFDGTIASNRSTVGTGVRASRPASTTNRVAYWATDAGGNWDTTHGGSNDGCLDVVVAGAWVDCAYTPATYPYPGTASSPPATISSLTPSSGTQGQASLSIAVVGSSTNFVNATTVCGFGANITINSCTVSDSTHLTANISIAGGAVAGARDAVFTTGGETATSTNGFTVNAAVSVGAGSRRLRRGI